LPLLCGAASPEQAKCLALHLADPDMFATSFPVPSIAVRDWKHYAKDMWRGPQLDPARLSGQHHVCRQSPPLAELSEFTEPYANFASKRKDLLSEDAMAATSGDAATGAP
jgi:hypothetical protein